MRVLIILMVILMSSSCYKREVISFSPSQVRPGGYVRLTMNDPLAYNLPFLYQPVVELVSEDGGYHQQIKLTLGRGRPFFKVPRAIHSGRYFIVYSGRSVPKSCFKKCLEVLPPLVRAVVCLFITQFISVFYYVKI